MDITKLVYAVTVADIKSLPEAASKLGVTRQAVSKAIKSLESEMRTKLFNQINGKLFLTNIGIKFISQAKKTLNEYGTLATEFIPQSLNKTCSSR